MEDDGAFFSRSQMLAVAPPRPTSPRCGACGLHAGCLTPKMPVDGEGRRKILVVAEAPGKNEDEQGIPLVGPTGQDAQRALRAAGIDMRRDCWLTNAIRCRPPGNKLADHPAAVDHCRPLLLRSIAELDPEVIILMGGAAVRSLIGHLWREDTKGISRWTGWRIPCHKPNAWVCPTFHPSFLSRQKDPVLDQLFAQHLRRAGKLRGRPWPDGPPDYAGAVEVILDPAHAAARVRRYRGGTVAFDFENTCLKPDGKRAGIVCCAVCWEGQETIAFPWHGEVIPAVEDLLGDPDVGKIASNLQHEERWVRRHLGFPVRNWVWDTMLAGHALDPRGGVTSLKFQSFVRLGAPYYAHHVEPFLIPAGGKKGGNAVNRVREVALTQLLTYCGQDALLEYEVAQHQRHEMGVTE